MTTNTFLSEKVELGTDTLVVRKPVRSGVARKKGLCQRIMAILCGIVILMIFFNSCSSCKQSRSEPKPITLYPGGGGTSGNVTDTVNLKQLLSVAIAVAEAGGKEVVAVRADADLGEGSKGETLEEANDLKTNGDMRSYVQMYYGLKKAFPNLNIISE